ncbi:MAG: aldehyde ferredoxin oxidoreductase, partial [Chloroflexi bacterium]|nr:aldehyde ferredoxin oxidoreductase [Chloroflexota bacterium]
MSTEKTSCYTGKVLRVDLTRETLTEELLDEATLRKWVGGVGLGARYLYEEVPPGVEWSDEENRLIIASGPVGGTRIGGSGTISVVTKGCLTNGATSTQANGFMGAYMKFAGYDAVIVQGAGRQWRYLYLHDGKAELRDATALIGKDFWETEDLIRKELQQSQRGVSIFGIGPAGENLVKFAAIVGDRGHVAGHNGVGAVLGSKKLKAIVAARGQGSVAVADSERVASLARDLWDNVRKARIYNNSIYQWGT